MMPMPANDVLATSQLTVVPEWNPGKGREHYIPDAAYFFDEPYRSANYTRFNQTLRAVVTCVGMFADRYEAAILPSQSIGDSTNRERHAVLPTQSDQKEAAL